MTYVFPKSFKLDDILPEYTWTLPVVQDAEKISHSLLDELRNGGINETSTCSAMITDLLLLQSYLPRCELAMSRLKYTLCILSATKRRINQCVLFRKSSRAPIRRLPVEILNLIFEEACALPTFGSSSPSTLPTTISSVCFHWRCVCLSTPSIWSNITVRHTSPDISNIMARINHYGSMSLDHALTFDLTTMVTTRSSQKQAMSAFRISKSSFLDRCSTVRLTMTGGGRAIYNNLIFRSPLLKSAEICALDISTKPWTMFAEAPNLQRLHIRGLKGSVTLRPLYQHPITTLTLSRCYSNLVWEFVGVTSATLVDCTEEIPDMAISLPININPAPSILESLSLTNTRLSSIIINGPSSFSHLATLEIILTPDYKLPATTLLKDLQYCLVSRPDLLPITSLSLRYIPISDAELINILDRIPLLREISIIEPDRREQAVLTELFMNYLREHPALESIELVLTATSDKEGIVMDMLEQRATLGLLKEVTLGIRHGTEMSAQTLERLGRLREQGIMATQW